MAPSRVSIFCIFKVASQRFSSFFSFWVKAVGPAISPISQAKWQFQYVGSWHRWSRIWDFRCLRYMRRVKRYWDYKSSCLLAGRWHWHKYFLITGWESQSRSRHIPIIAGYSSLHVIPLRPVQLCWGWDRERQNGIIEALKLWNIRYHPKQLWVSYTPMLLFVYELDW